MKVFDSLNQAISSGRERRKKEMAVLKDSRRTYLTLRPFPGRLGRRRRQAGAAFVPDGCAHWQHDPDGTVFGYGFGKSVCYYMGVLSRLVHRRVRYLFNPKLETLFFAKVREKGGNP